MKELARLRDALDQVGELGDLDEPKDYFSGRITMQYGAFDMVNPPVIYLIGETERTIIALGGSLKNYEGRDPDEVKARDNAQVILSEVEVARAVRRAQIGGSPSRVTGTRLYNRTGLKGSPRLVHDKPYNTQPSPDQWAVDIAETLWRWSTGNPPKDFEVLAQREEFTPAPPIVRNRTQKNILVGSPVYVREL